MSPWDMAVATYLLNCIHLLSFILFAFHIISIQVREKTVNVFHANCVLPQRSVIVGGQSRIRNVVLDMQVSV
jgi:hypothetical protein